MFGVIKNLIVLFSLSTVISASRTKQFEKQVVDVALFFNFQKKYDKTVGNLRKGALLAKKHFETKYRNLEIKYHEINHGEDLGSVLKGLKKIKKLEIDYVIGGEFSTEAMLMSEKLNNAKKIFITPTATSPQISKNRKFSFQIASDDSYRAIALAQKIAKGLRLKNIGVMHELSSPYSNHYTKYFLNELEKISPKSIKGIHKFTKANYKFRDAIKKFKDDGVENVVFLGYESDFLPFLEEAAKQDFYPNYIGSDGWGPSKKVQESYFDHEIDSKRMKTTLYQTSYIDLSFNTPVAKKFKTDFSNQYSHMPDAWNTLAYDSATLLFKGFETTISINPKRVRDAILKLSSLDLVSSKSISFDKNNILIKELILFEIKSDSLKVVLDE